LLDDLRETFVNHDRYNIKLNPKKCSFGVPTGQLLGHLIFERGIEGNPEKIQALINMQLPKMLRHVQQLTCRLAALSGSISKLGKKAVPFAVTQHTTACCSTQVVDIILMKLHSTNITSLRVVQ
jgi:hypothetical protein